MVISMCTSPMVLSKVLICHPVVFYGSVCSRIFSPRIYVSEVLHLALCSILSLFSVWRYNGFKHHLLKTILFPGNLLLHLGQKSVVSIYVLVSCEFSFPFCWFICLSLSQYYIVLMPISFLIFGRIEGLTILIIRHISPFIWVFLEFFQQCFTVFSV
jgi:hypothetical protein